MKPKSLILPLLTGLLMAGAAIAQDAPDAFQKLSDEFTVVWRKWSTDKTGAQRGKTDESELKRILDAEPTPKYIPRFQAGAKQHKGTNEAIPYLGWLVSWGGTAANDALDQLAHDHIQHAQMGRIVFSIALKARRSGFSRDQALAFQSQVASKTKDPKIKADALFWRAYVITGTESSDTEKKQSLQDLAVAVELGDKRTKQRAKGLLFELQNLQIGMVAPDITGKDLDGVEFKLSDYRGKVIMLDFWGDW